MKTMKMLRVEVLTLFSSHVNCTKSIKPKMAQLVSPGFYHSVGILKLYIFFIFCFLILFYM